MTDRPFVYAEIWLRKYPDQNPTMWAISLRLTNSGQDWAKRINAAMARGDKIEWSSAQWMTGAEFVLAPGQKTDLQFGVVHMNEVNDYVRNKALNLFADVKYSGSNSGDCRTQIAMKFNADDDGGVSVGFLPDHNCVDGDCTP